MIHDRERWHARLAATAEELASSGESASNDLKALNDLRDFALPIIDSLASLPEQAHWGIWFEALSALAGKALGVIDPILETLEELAPPAELGPVGLTDVLSLLEATTQTALLLHMSQGTAKYLLHPSPRPGP